MSSKNTGATSYYGSSAHCLTSKKNTSKKAVFIFKYFLIMCCGFKLFVPSQLWQSRDAFKIITEDQSFATANPSSHKLGHQYTREAVSQRHEHLYWFISEFNSFIS